MNGETNLLTGMVIGRGIDTHKALGPGLKEAFYQSLLSSLMRKSGIQHDNKPRRPLVHRGYVADEFEVDLLFGTALLADLKVLTGPFAQEHLAQVIAYLKFWAITIGLLLDFGKERLIPKRVIFEDPPRIFPSLKAMTSQAPSCANAFHVNEVCERVLRLGAQYGFGYREKTYRGLFRSDCAADGVGFLDQPTAIIKTTEDCLGEAELACQFVPNQCAILILALNESIRAADRAVLAGCLRHLGFPWGLVVNFGKTRFDYSFVINPDL